jgi:hypothetical protein
MGKKIALISIGLNTGVAVILSFIARLILGK